MTLSRQLDLAARRFADNQSNRLAELPTDRKFFADVTVATAGAGAGGNYLVKVLWRSGEYEVAAYNSAYTPVVGDRVKCELVDNQLTVEGRYIN